VLGCWAPAATWLLLRANKDLKVRHLYGTKQTRRMPSPVHTGRFKRVCLPHVPPTHMLHETLSLAHCVKLEPGNHWHHPCRSVSELQVSFRVRFTGVKVLEAKSRFWRSISSSPRLVKCLASLILSLPASQCQTYGQVMGVATGPGPVAITNTFAHFNPTSGSGRLRLLIQPPLGPVTPISPRRCSRGPHLL
jgi:hypothetical protein